MKKVWLVAHPTSRYNEDVMRLASQNNLRVVDSIYSANFDPNIIEQNPPKLTIKGESQESKPEEPRAEKRKSKKGRKEIQIDIEDA